MRVLLGIEQERARSCRIIDGKALLVLTTQKGNLGHELYNRLRCIELTSFLTRISRKLTDCTIASPAYHQHDQQYSTANFMTAATVWFCFCGVVPE